MGLQESKIDRGNNLIEDVVFGLGIIGTVLVVDGLDAAFRIGERVHPLVNALKSRIPSLPKQITSLPAKSRKDLEENVIRGTLTDD